MTTPQTMVEEGLQLFFDHAPTEEELAPYIVRMKAMGCENVTAEIESDWGDDALYWEATIIGDHPDDRFTPQGWTDLNVMPVRLTPYTDVQFANPYVTKPPPPYFDRVLFARRDKSMRAIRVVLEGRYGTRLDIVISRKALAQIEHEEAL